MKRTVVCGGAVSRLARCENWELWVLCDRTSNRPSWHTWWPRCDSDVFLALMPGWTHPLLIVWTLFWATLPSVTINAYVSAPIYSILVACSTTKIMTAVSKYLCVMSWIGKMVAHLRIYSFFLPFVYVCWQEWSLGDTWQIVVRERFCILQVHTVLKNINSLLVSQ